MVIQEKLIRTHKETWERLDKLRTTEKGKVSFDDVIRFLLRKSGY
jgi:predicted CopG family antitoxin